LIIYFFLDNFIIFAKTIKMKSYNLTIFDAKSEFNLETFYDDFAQVSDTEPLETKLGRNYVLIFGTDVELLDLSTFISSILFDNVGGYFLTEITTDVAAYMPMSKFANLTLTPENVKAQSKKQGDKKILAIMKSERLNEMYVNATSHTATPKRDVIVTYDLDTILDKIAKSGVDSLTTNERNFLDNYSA
jgi:hypothetical protein